MNLAIAPMLVEARMMQEALQAAGTRITLEARHARLSAACQAQGVSWNRPPTPSEVLLLVAEKHEVSVDDLVGPSVERQIARARQEAMWVLRQRKRPDDSHVFSFQRIGMLLGGRHYSTIMNGVDAHERRMLEAKSAHQNATDPAQ